MVQQLRYRMQAFAVAHLIKNLFDFLRIVLRLHLHRLWLAHELRGQLGNAFGIRGREQQSLAVFGALTRHLGDVVKKTHVQHAVGFVEHQHLQALQAERATL